MSTLERRPKTSRRRPPGPSLTARPTLLVFGSATSGDSRRTDGFLANVLQHRRNHETFRIVRVDADQRPDVLTRFAIQEIPTLVVLVDGEIRARLSKPRGCRTISDLLSPWLK